jgi:hypothetical protein
MKHLLLLVVILFGCGCGSYFTGIGQNAAAGAVNGATSNDATNKLSGLTTAATKAARDEALGPTTDADLKKLIADLDPELQKVITDTGTTTRAQLNTLITQALQEKVQKALRLSIDEALGAKTMTEANALREELVGPPLQKDLDAIIDSVAPHLAQAVQQAVQSSLAPLQTDVTSIKSQADLEAAKWKPIAIGFGVGTGILLICLVLAVYVVRSHHQVIQTLVRERKPA